MTVPLHEIAHARAGDKGDTSIIMVAPYRAEDMDVLLRTVTSSSVAAHFGVSEAQVSIRPLVALRAVTVVVRGRLVGGVTRSPTADPHGKTLSAHLLGMPAAEAAP